MDKNKLVKGLGITLSVVGFGITMVQKQLELNDRNKIIAKEVAKQLKESMLKEID